MTSLPFFLNTWEEYYTGELVLPIVNGTGEGNVAACIVMMITGELGREFWIQKINFVGFTTSVNHLSVILFFITGFFFAVLSFVKVLLEFKEKMNEALQNLSFFLLSVMSLLIVVYYGDSDIIRNHPKIINIVYGFSFAKLVGHLLLAHLAHSKFLQYRKSLLSSSIILAGAALLDHFFDIKFLELDNLIIIMLITQIVGNILFS